MIETRENADRDGHEKSHHGEYCESWEDTRQVFVVRYAEPEEYYYVAGESDEEGQVEVVSLSEVEPSTKQ